MSDDDDKPICPPHPGATSTETDKGDYIEVKATCSRCGEHLNTTIVPKDFP
jgi:hypothetical protein